MATPAALGRPVFTGSITFGLVAVPVKLYPATESGHGPVAHMYHRDDLGRVRNRRYCAAEDRELTLDDIARGWETPDGGMVVLTDEDMEQLPLASKHTIDVHAFLPASQIPDLMFDTPYYVGLGDKAPAKPYVLLHRAMTESGTVAVTKVALRERESLAVLRPVGDVLVLQTVRWPDEIRPSEGIAPKADDAEMPRPQEIKMAQQLMASMSVGYDLDAERDQYVKALNELLIAKTGGGEVQASPEALPTAVPTMDIMAALQASIAESKAKRGEEPAAKKTPVKKRAPRRAS